jgi:hypothetical protein
MVVSQITQSVRVNKSAIGIRLYVPVGISIGAIIAVTGRISTINSNFRVSNNQPTNAKVGTPNNKPMIILSKPTAAPAPADKSITLAMMLIRRIICRRSSEVCVLPEFKA